MVYKGNFLNFSIVSIRAFPLCLLTEIKSCLDKINKLTNRTNCPVISPINRPEKLSFKSPNAREKETGVIEVMIWLIDKALYFLYLFNSLVNMVLNPKKSVEKGRKYSQISSFEVVKNLH